MSDRSIRPSGVRAPDSDAGDVARSARDRTAAGDAWSPPSITGPLITFRGKQAAVSSLQDEVGAAREAGYERGRSEGLAAAAAEIAQRTAELRSRLQFIDEIARQMAAPLDRCDEETVAEMAALALAVGAQLARRELTADPAQVVAIIRECVDSLPSSAREVRIHLHPRDAAAIRRAMEAGGGDASWTLVEDPESSRGGCRIEAEASHLDAGFEARVAAAFVTILGEGQAGDLDGEAPPPPGRGPRRSSPAASDGGGRRRIGKRTSA